MRDLDTKLHFLEHPESLRVILLVVPSLGSDKRNMLHSPLSLQVIKMVIHPSAPPLSSTCTALWSGKGMGVVLWYWWWLD